jgi:hypothetical protein
MKLRLSLFAGVLALCGMTGTGLSQATNMSITTGSISGASDWLTASQYPAGSSVVTADYFTVNDSNPAPTITMNGVAVHGTSSTITNGGQTVPSFYNSGAGSLTYTFATGSGENMSGSHDGPAANSNVLSGNQTYWTNLGPGNGVTDHYTYILANEIYSAHGVGPDIGGQSASTMSLTIGGLTSGDNYVVRFFTAVTAKGAGYTETIGADSVTSAAANVGISTSPSVGSYFTASFTAVGSTETFDFTGLGGPAELNALEVLQAVPEPSTVALMSVAVGLVGLMAVRRRKLALAA